MPRYVTKEVVQAAVTAAAERLVGRGQPSTVVADLRAVERFDLIAPIVALKIARPVASLIAHVDILASNKLVVVAATSAASVLGVRFTVRSEDS